MFFRVVSKEGAQVHEVRSIAYGPRDIRLLRLRFFRDRRSKAIEQPPRGSIEERYYSRWKGKREDSYYSFCADEEKGANESDVLGTGCYQQSSRKRSQGGQSSLHGQAAQERNIGHVVGV